MGLRLIVDAADEAEARLKGIVGVRKAYASKPWLADRLTATPATYEDREVHAAQLRLGPDDRLKIGLPAKRGTT
jgi:hypothetical protein